MMLSRLAWQLYWIGRHLERAENTARAMLAQETLFHHPQGHAAQNWPRLLSALEQNTVDPGQSDDARIFHFLYKNTDNPNSLTSLVHALRNDMRTMHGLLPAEMWRFSGRLRDLTAQPLAAAGRRRQNLDDFVRYCRASAGVATTAMLRDSAFYFWQIGRRLECADMTCRLLSGELAASAESETDEATPAETLRWANWLAAFGVMEAYRSINAPLNGAAIAVFMVNNNHLPRAAQFCLAEVRDCLQYLPANEKPLVAVARAAQTAFLSENISTVRAAAKLRRTVAANAAAGKSIAAAYFAEL